MSKQGTSCSTTNAGRLEIFLNDQWGTVCDNGFHSDDATVACRQLGFEGYVLYSTEGIRSLGYVSKLKNCYAIMKINYFQYCSYTPASIDVPTWLDNLDCTPNDASIESCSHQGIGVHSCHLDHTEDIALVCYGSKYFAHNIIMQKYIIL